MNVQAFANKLRFEREKLFILLFPEKSLEIDNIKSYCNINCVQFLDYAEEIKKEIITGQTTNLISFDSEIKRIEKLCERFERRILIFFNFDIVLSYFEYDDLKYFWNHLRRKPHLSAIPGIPLHQNSDLLPLDIEAWKKDGRLYNII